MDSMMWLRLVFAVILLGGTGVGFMILFSGLVDEETRQQAAKVRAQVRTARKKASAARSKALKKAWSTRRDGLFRELSRCYEGSIAHYVISKQITDHLANKP